MKDIRTLLISNERDSILSNAEQSTVQSEVQGIFHTKHLQDTHESLLNILDIVHTHTKIDLFPGLPFSQENHSTYTCTACKFVTTTSSNFCELEITLEISTGTSMPKYYNFTKLCYLCNSNKSHTHQNVII